MFNHLKKLFQIISEKLSSYISKFTKEPADITFSYTPLVENDIPMLCNWFKLPHVKEWWNEILTDEEINEKYQSRISNSNIFCFIIQMNNKPIGFFQYYLISQGNADWCKDEVEGTVGIDLFIANSDQLHKGYEQCIISHVSRDLMQHPNIKKIVCDVDITNMKAITYFEKVGFNQERKVSMSDSNTFVIMSYYRDTRIDSHAYLMKKADNISRLYKIVSSNNFIDMLQKNYLYFRRVDTYHDDRRDSGLPDEDKELCERVCFEGSEIPLEYYYNKFRERAYACCFSTVCSEFLEKHYNGDIRLEVDAIKFRNLLYATYDTNRVVQGNRSGHAPFDLNSGLVEYGSISGRYMKERYLVPIQYSYFKDGSKYFEENEFRITLSLFFGHVWPNGDPLVMSESCMLEFNFFDAINQDVIIKIHFFTEDNNLKNQITSILSEKVTNEKLQRLLN